MIEGVLIVAYLGFLVWVIKWAGKQNRFKE